MNEGLETCGSPSVTSYRNGCRCEACKSAQLVANKKRGLKFMKDGPQIVDATASRERLAELVASGMSQREIRNFGLSLPTIHEILSGKRTAIRKDTERKIFAISGRRMNRKQRVDPAEATKIVRKWHDCGLSYPLISRITGISYGTLQRIGSGSSSWVYADTMVRLVMHREDVFDAIVCKVKEKKEKRRKDNGKDNQGTRQVQVHQGRQEGTQEPEEAPQEAENREAHPQQGIHDWV
jgi:hypothetical protein